MEKQAYTWTVSIIAQYDQSVEEIKEKYAELEESILIQKWSRRIRYLIFFYDQKTRQACIKKLKKGFLKRSAFKTIKQLGVIDLYDGEKLIDFFKSYVDGDFSQQQNHRHLLFTWGHGLGLGFFLEETKKDTTSNDANENDSNTEYKQTIQKLKFLKANLSVTDRHIDFDKLYSRSPGFVIPKGAHYTNWENSLKDEIKLIPAEFFSKIISEGLGKTKINILLILNCFMQTFETGYALKDNVEYFIAPQTTMAFDGYNYKRLFNLLHKKPEADCVEISRNVIDYFDEKYLQNTEKESSDKRAKVDASEIAISANYLPHYTSIKDVINEIAVFLLENYGVSNSWSDKIDDARKFCFYLTKGYNMGIIDFKHFASEFTKQIIRERSGDRFLKMFKKLDDHHRKVIVAHRAAGSHYWNHVSRVFNIVSKSPQFFSIFFPNERGEDRYVVYFIENFYAPNSPDQPRLNYDFKWDEWVMYYCKIKNIYP